MEIQALSFDADQTLWDYRRVQQLALESTIDLMKTEGIVAHDDVSMDELQRIRDIVAAEFPGRPHTLEEVREQSFVRFLESRGHSAPESTGTQLAEHFLKTRFDHVCLYPDVAAVMPRLKSRYRLGLLTNANTYPDRCGLPDTFDAEVRRGESRWMRVDPH